MKYFLMPLVLLIFFASCTHDDEDSEYYGFGYPNYGGPGYIPGDQYSEYGENDFIYTKEEATSTFSVDADGASYANVRSFLENGYPVPENAVRIEEFINYFNLDYPNNETDPITLNGEVSSCPWDASHKLIRIGIKGKHIPKDKLPPSNYVFLIDVSGSMNGNDRLPLLKTGFKNFVETLSDQDKVSIVTYSSSVNTALSTTYASDKNKIKNALDKLSSGGGTYGEAGLRKAYEVATHSFIENCANNRIILASDGDFNIGMSSQSDLVSLIEEKRNSGIFLTIIGVGRGNFNDATLEQVADNGNGSFEYLDKVEQLEKVFIYESNKFHTVAKDLKIQVEFNPDIIKAYRLVGYENRVLNNEDFDDDTKDAGEVGADQNITALYEIIPEENPNFRTSPSFTIDSRYKLPCEETSSEIKLNIFDAGNSFENASDHQKFTTAVAAFAMLLSQSKYLNNTAKTDILNWLNSTTLEDSYGFKKEFKELISLYNTTP